jgi:hypothetical protein
MIVAEMECASLEAFEKMMAAARRGVLGGGVLSEVAIGGDQIGNRACGRGATVDRRGLRTADCGFNFGGQIGHAVDHSFAEFNV